MLTWTYTIVLDIKGKHNFKHVYYTHVVEIPTQKGEHSRKCCPQAKRGIVSSCKSLQNYFLFRLFKKDV